jgi:prepilin-type N-terminal cleavage/methylation domain-containing protein
MTLTRNPARRAFSLLELVIVIVIIGIIAAIAIPRMSRGAEGANDSALSANLAVLRNAIDLYHTEHEGAYPTAAGFNNMMMQYTDVNSGVSATQTGAFIYGPYLRSIPAVPNIKVLTNARGSSTVAAAAGAGVGWIYTETTGVITVNATTETDKKGKLYLSY